MTICDTPSAQNLADCATTVPNILYQKLALYAYSISNSIILALYIIAYDTACDTCGELGLVDRVLSLHAGSRGFDSHWGHMSERFFRSNRPGYPQPVSSELENSGIRVAVGDCSVSERRR